MGLKQIHSGRISRRANTIKEPAKAEGADVDGGTGWAENDNESEEIYYIKSLIMSVTKSNGRR